MLVGLSDFRDDVDTKCVCITVRMHRKCEEGNRMTPTLSLQISNRRRNMYHYDNNYTVLQPSQVR